MRLMTNTSIPLAVIPLLLAFAACNETALPFATETFTCKAPDRPPNPFAEIVSAFPELPAFERPVSLTKAPGNSTRWYLAEQGGKLWRFDNNSTTTTRSLVLDISDQIETLDPAGGLLNLVFHPSFALNGEAFLYYTAAAGPTGIEARLSRLRSLDGGLSLDPDSEEILLAIASNGVHYGGTLGFDSGGYFYLSVGDGNSSADAQDPTTLLGSVLRIDVDTTDTTCGTPYAIPPTNPFAGGACNPAAGRREVFAWGLRNPWRGSIDPATGALWLADVGATNWEEVNRVESGENHGWPLREGRHCFPPGSEPCPTAGLTDPVSEYSHLEGISIVGGHHYSGSQIPELAGMFLYGDFGSGTIWALANPYTAPADQVLLANSGHNISSFAQDESGEILFLSYWNGTIERIAPSSNTAPDPLPKHLSQTGCMDVRNPSVPVSGAYPYAINAELWSDGAAKERFLYVPDGESIIVHPDGDWDLPVGTVAIKNFRLAERLIETRLLLRHEDGGWAGYSYEWNLAQTQATLLASSKTKTVAGQAYTFPSRSQCLECHTAAAGRTLGLEIQQLNRLFPYPDGTENQITFLSQELSFLPRITTPPASLPALTPIDSAAPTEERARAYLHANCSICHRPGGNVPDAMDLRASASLLESNLCNTDPIEGDLGVPGAKLLAPGDPARSILSLRMHNVGIERMPPLASHVEDTAATAVIDTWIGSIAGCP